MGHGPFGDFDKHAEDGFLQGEAKIGGGDGGGELWGGRFGGGGGFGWFGRSGGFGGLGGFGWSGGGVLGGEVQLGQAIDGG